MISPTARGRRVEVGDDEQSRVGAAITVIGEPRYRDRALRAQVTPTPVSAPAAVTPAVAENAA